MFKNSSMSKTAKKGPWVPPPGRSRKVDSNSSKAKPFPKVKTDFLLLEDASNFYSHIPNFILALNIENFDGELNKFSPNTTTKSQEETTDSQKLDDDTELESLCSNYSICSNKAEMKIYLQDIKQEQRLLNLYFMSLRPISQFLSRSTNMKHTILCELVSKIEKQLNYLMKSFEDLEFSLCSFENNINETEKSGELKKILKMKENILLKLLECYTDILNVFQNSIEEYSNHNTEKLENEQVSLKTQLQAYEKRNSIQASAIKDLEKRVSLLQNKNSTLESYNTTLEETRAELQQLLQYKDVQLKNINLDINEVPKTSNDERLIELIEEIKAKAQAEKTALKKALKVYKLQLQQKDQLLKKQETDISEKVQMLFDLAAQRDKLKVQLTVSNNEIIQTKYRMEEIKCQKLKLKNELNECEINKNKFEEELNLLKKQTSQRGEKEHIMQEEIKKLKDELNSTINKLEATKSSLNTQNQNEQKNLEEVKVLISLLEDTKEYLKAVKQPDVHAKGDGNQIDINAENQSILAVMQDIRQQMVEIRKTGVTGDSSDNNKDALVKHIEELEKSQKLLTEENASLKLQIKDLQNSSNAEIAPSFENAPVNVGYEFSAQNLQMELRLKTEEIYRIKQREKKLEYQLEEVKDKLQKKEMENSRIFTLEESLKRKEEDLRKTENDLYLLERKKHEETETLLTRTRELQEALDEKIASYDSLERFVDTLKSSLYNVFGTS